MSVLRASFERSSITTVNACTATMLSGSTAISHADAPALPPADETFTGGDGAGFTGISTTISSSSGAAAAACRSSPFTAMCTQLPSIDPPS
jgi:hypothetical protein